MRVLEERKILKALKIAPFGLLFFSLIIIFIVITDDYLNLNKELKSLEINYIHEQKTIIKKEVNKVFDYINYEKNNAEKELKENLKNRVYEAHSIASNLYSKYKETKSKEEITTIIIEALRNIRFNNGRGYYYILTTSNAVNLLNGFQPALEGKNLYNLQDSKGKYLNREIIKVIKATGEGYVDYFWYKPNTDNEMYKKFTFSKEFEPYQFYIGTGEYLIDFEKNLKEEILDYVSTITYGKNGYVFINSFEGVNLAHIKKSFRGTNFNNLKGPNGIYSVRELNKIAKKGEGYLEYQGQIVPSTGKKGKKISFVKGFNDWKWAIGSGVYLKDIGKVIVERKKTIESQNKNKIIKIVIAMLFTIVLFFFIAVLISKQVSRMFNDYSQDIDEQIIKNEKLTNNFKKKSAEFETIIQEAPNPMILHNEDGKILILNKAWTDISGYTQGEISTIEKWIITVYKDLDTQNEVKKHISGLYDITKKVNEGTFTFSTKSNKEIIWQVSSSPLGLIDGKRTIITSAMDITELKNKDEMLINQSRQAAMGEMIGMIAHQWRQPLSVIAMDANNMLLDVGLENFDSNDAEKYAKSITSQTQHLSKTIDDFRNFFKPDKEILEIDIKEILDGTLSIVKDSLTNNNIKLLSTFETDKKVKAYPRELMQVFVNIITNSKDVLSSNKPKDAQIDIRVYADEKYINTEICDNGGGINMEILPKVFDPYFSTKEAKNGTGLGLYMSKMIIENHLNGKIDVYNKNDGACFTVKLLKD